MPFSVPESIKNLNPRVVPIQRGKKGPTIKGWTETKVRAQEIDTEDPNADKYGIVLDDDWLVIDVDVHDEARNGYAALEELSKDIGVDLWEKAQIVVRSPSGGAHLYFSKDPDVRYPKSVQRYPGLDFLTKGMQVIGPGSEHVAGGTYEIEHKRSGGLTLAPIGLSGALAEGRSVLEETTPQAEVSISPVDDFNTSHLGIEFVRHTLASKGYTVLTKGDGSYEFIRPGKTDRSDHAISGTLGKSVSKGGRNLLRNFSTNDPFGLPADRAITVSEAYRILSGLEQEELPIHLRDADFGFGAKALSTEVRVETDGDDIERSYPTLTLDELRSQCGLERHPYLVSGLLRKGETMNLIAAPKTGKSWFVYNLALTLANGGEFLGFSSPEDLKCLIVDNELHAAELAWRVTQVEQALGHTSGDSLHFSSLRGAEVDIFQLESKLESCGAGRFDVVILDALYRFLPKGFSENDNAQMMLVYNALDRIARTFGVAVICVHHTSKGNQSEKSVTDAGAGAGAISRAADTQVVLLPHEVKELVCMECVTRSSPSPPARSVRLEGFKWELEDVPAVRQKINPGAANGMEAIKAKQDLKRSRRAKKLGEYLESSDSIFPEQSQEVIQEELSERWFSNFLGHAVSAGVLHEPARKGRPWTRSEEWREKLGEWIG